MSFRWIYREPEDADAVATLQDRLGVEEILARLLVLRNITTFEQAHTFFRSSLESLYDPYLMKDMDKAAARVAKAVRNNEHIVVYGDYDVDGTTATSIVYSFLKEFGCCVDYYIPHRFKEGYGISPEGVEYAKEINATLLISVDCGITAIEETKMANELGIDVVICDHHTAGDAIPEALAVLDPKRPDCPYPFEGLSGAGVGFKLVQATLTELGLPQTVAYKYLDLLAISIASDIVPVVDENRILMREGLKILNSHPRPGIKALMDLINLKPGNLNGTRIVFSIGPRINAAGRLGDAKIAVELLIAETEAEANAFAHQLEAINIKRRTIDSDTMDRAVEMLEDVKDIEDLNSLVLHHPDWHLGVIGIVASRLVDKFYRPTIMLSTVDGLAKGSARSIQGFNVYEALKECEDMLIQFGGHEYAAGLTLKEEDIAEFRKRFNLIVDKHLSEKIFEPELAIDAMLNLEDVNTKFWKVLRQFEPFGPMNMRPIFTSENVKVTMTPTIVGNGHIKFKVRQGNSAEFEAIGFNMHEYLPLVRDSEPGKLCIAYVLDENHWNGRTSLQLRLKDVKKMED